MISIDFSVSLFVVGVNPRAGNPSAKECVRVLLGYYVCRRHLEWGGASRSPLYTYPLALNGETNIFFSFFFGVDEDGEIADRVRRWMPARSSGDRR